MILKHSDIKKELADDIDSFFIDDWDNDIPIEELEDRAVLQESDLKINPCMKIEKLDSKTKNTG